MTDLPVAGLFTDPATTNDLAKAAQDDLVEVVRESPGGQVETEITISGGTVTPVHGVHTVDTEADAAADDLVNIAQTSLRDGVFLLIRCQDAARVVTVKHGGGGAGQILMVDGADFVLDDVTKVLWLRRDGTVWREVGRFYGADIAGAKAYLGLATAALTDAAQTFTAPQRTQESDLGNQSGSVALDFATANDFKLTTTAAITLANPTNITAGQKGTVRVDDTGGFGLTGMGTYWKRVDGTGAPTLSAGVNRIDYHAVTATEIHYRWAGVE